MVTKKDLIIAVLATFCLTATIFMVIPTRSQSGQYDPWLDINDDGTINIVDISRVAKAFWASGTPINKTDLLLQLEARIAALEAQEIADYTVTDIKLAAGAIPHNETCSMTTAKTSSKMFVDIPGASVTITLNRNSTLIITFSATTFLEYEAENYYFFICWRAMVSSMQAYPHPTQASNMMITESIDPDRDSRSFTFYLPGVGPGKYIINMQWRAASGLYPEHTTTAYIIDRSLIVIALPDA